MTIDAAYVLMILAGAGSVIAMLFRLLISSKDREYALLLADKDRLLADLTSRNKSYQEMTAESIKTATDIANYYRSKYEDKPPIIPLVPVVPESHSPSTESQRETASIATMRAQIAQVRLEHAMIPRPEPERAIEPPKGAKP